MYINKMREGLTVCLSVIRNSAQTESLGGLKFDSSGGQEGS